MNAHHQAEWSFPLVDLHDKKIVVIGASGGVGADVTHELLTAGASVVGTGRDQARLASLVQRMETTTLQGSLETAVLDAQGHRFDEEVADLDRRHGPFDAVVIAVGTWGVQGPKTAVDLSDSEWSALLDGNLTSIYRLFKAFLPTIAQGGALLQINGLSAEVPYPNNSVVALSAAATKSLFRTAEVELAGGPVQLYHLILGVIATTAVPDAAKYGYVTIGGAQVGRHVAALLSGESPLAGEMLQYFVDPVEGPRRGANQY
ncbi:MAG: SDR family NAD(P)-dependent oxidoreductase [Janthinobacterium lividum]